MTYRDPYKDPARDTDPYEAFDQGPRVLRARKEGYSSGSMIGALIAIVLIVAALMYTVQRTISSSGTSPSTTTSAPTTTGQGGGPAPSGTAR